MREKHALISNPEQLRWTTMDMMNMEYPNDTFDVVIDKATMDVIMTDNKDPWNPTEEVKSRGVLFMKNVYKLLK